MGDEPADGYLAPLPRRVMEGADESGAGAPAVDPLPFSEELLERANVLLATLDRDVAQLREEQAEAIVRIEQEHARQEVAAAEAAQELERLLDEARDTAQRKGKAELLTRGMQSRIDPRKVRPLSAIVAELEQELRAAQGITGAIRLEAIGVLLLEAHFCVELLKRKAEASKAALITETERDLEKESTEAGASFQIGMDLLIRDLGLLDAALPPAALAWEHEAWDRWVPPQTPSTLVRLGGLTRPAMGDVAVPALLDLGTVAGLLLEGGTLRDEALGITRSTVLRLLAGLPPGGLQLTLVDPTGLGSSFGPFLALAEDDPALLAGGVATLEADIDAALASLAGHVERVIRQFLRGRHATLADCTAAAGEVVEPFRALVVADYPTGFSEQAQELVQRLIEQGPQAGLFTILVRDPTAKAKGRGAARRRVPTGLLHLRAEGGVLMVDRGVAGRWPLLPDEVPPTRPGAGPPPAVVERVVQAVGQGARSGGRGALDVAGAWRLLADASRAAVRLDLPALRRTVDPEAPRTWWGGEVGPRLAVPIGRSGLLDVATLVLDGRDHGSALIVGEPESGVSTLLTTVVTGLSLAYAPGRLDLQLVSLGDRATFAPAATAGLPQASLVADNAERELGLAVLDRLARQVELERHRRLEHDDGAPHEPERRTVLVLDGVEELTVVEDTDSRRALAQLETLIQDGPDHGVHVVLAVRAAPAGSEEESPATLRALERLPVDAIGTRILLHGGTEVTRAVLAGATMNEGDEPVRPGEAVVLSGSGPSASVRPIRLTLTTAKDRYRLLRTLRELATANGIAARPQIHDGTAAARLELSPLQRLLANAEQRDHRLLPRLWLGEPATLGDPVEVQLRRQEGANLLIVSEEHASGAGMLLAAVTSTVLVHGATADVRVLDFTPLETGLTEGAQAFSAHWPVSVERRRNLLKVLDGVHRVVQDRLTAGHYDQRPVVLVVAGIDRARDLEPGSVPDHEPDPVKVLEAVLRDGPDVGVHTVVWSTSLAALERRLGRSAVREFALRAVTRLSEDDSNALIDSGAASALRANQALLHDEDWGRLVRFRPYLPPPTSWLVGLSNAAAGVAADA